MVSTSVKGMQNKDDEKTMNKMSGMNQKDLKYLDQQKKLTMINFLKEKLQREEEQKKIEKEKKREKKERKKERKARKSRRRSRSRSVSSDDSRDGHKRRKESK